MSKSNLATKILEHPDHDEVIAKLISGLTAKDIHEWLEAKYPEVGSRFVLTEKSLISFQKDYLDFYSAIREDLLKTNKLQKSPDQELGIEVQGSDAYKNKLKEYLDSEVDIKTIVKKLLCNIEFRASQVFDEIQADPSNMKMDRILIEWFNTLTILLEKYDLILNGNPDQINIQNNISIQVVDDRINVIYNLIREILAQIDYESSIMFMDRFNEEMKKLQPMETIVLPVEKRL